VLGTPHLSQLPKIFDPANLSGLVIVGASHKGYLDAYLDQMHDLRVVSTNNILR
jgi:hypothetical protein